MIRVEAVGKDGCRAVVEESASFLAAADETAFWHQALGALQRVLRQDEPQSHFPSVDVAS